MPAASRSRCSQNRRSRPRSSSPLPERLRAFEPPAPEPDRSAPAGQQASMIATLQLLVGYLVFVRAVQRHQPAPLAQFDCNENCATMLGGGRGCGRCLHLTLRGFECGNPNLIGKATLTASWNLQFYALTT